MTTPHASFAYVVRLANGNSFGGFGEVSGLTSDVPRRGLTLVLKRGVVNSAALSEWLRVARLTDPSAKKTITVTAFDAGRTPTKSWTLTGVLPAKYTGPALSGKGVDVAIEELHLSAEGLDLGSQ